MHGIRGHASTKFKQNTWFEYLQKISVIPFGAFLQPLNNLRIISWQHVDRRQVLSTVDRRPLPVDHTQRPALYTARWRLGVTQRVARSVGVSQDLLKTFRSRIFRLIICWLETDCVDYHGCNLPITETVNKVCSSSIMSPNHVTSSSYKTFQARSEIVTL